MPKPRGVAAWWNEGLESPQTSNLLVSNTSQVSLVPQIVGTDEVPKESPECPTRTLLETPPKWWPAMGPSWTQVPPRVFARPCNLSPLQTRKSKQGWDLSQNGVRPSSTHPPTKVTLALLLQHHSDVSSNNAYTRSNPRCIFTVTFS